MLRYSFFLIVFFIIPISFLDAKDEKTFPALFNDLRKQAKDENIDWAEAVDYYGRAIERLNKQADQEKICVKLAETYRCRAYSFFRNDNLIRSLSDLRTATSLVDNELDNIRSNTKIYLYFQTDHEEFFKKSGIVALVLKESTENIEKLHQLLKQTPESTELSKHLALVYFLRGMVLWVNGLAYGGIGDFYKVKQYDPDNEIGIEEIFYVFGKAWPLVEEMQKIPKDQDKIKNIVQKFLSDKNVGWFARFLAHRELCGILYGEGKYREAVEEASKALELRRDIPIPVFRAAVLIERGQLYVLLEKYDEAVFDFAESIQFSENADAHLKWATTLRHAGHHDRAVAKLTEVIERFSIKTPDIYLFRADSLRTLKRYDECLADCDQVIALGPQKAKAYMVKGLTFSEMDEYEKAIEQYTKGLEIDPNCAIGYFTRAQLHYLLDEYEKTLADFAKAAELDPKYREEYEKFNHSYRSAFDPSYPPEKAIEYLNERLQENPDKTHYLCKRAERYIQLKNYEKAFEDAEQALRLQPEDNDVMVFWMKVAERFRSFNNNEENKKKIGERLENYCNKLLNKQNESINREDILMLRACLFRDRKEYAKALADFEAILEVESAPNSRLRCAYLNLHLAEKETDSAKRKARIEKALQYANRVIESGQAHEKGSDYFCRGKVHEALGETDQAEQDFQKAKEFGFEGGEDSLYIIKQ